MKKLILFLVVAVAALTANAYDFMVDGLYYTITNSDLKQVIVTYENYQSPGSTYRSLSGALTIPSTVTYNGVTYSVTGIDAYVFQNCSGLTSVIIPNSVTSIGSRTFQGCIGLKSVIIPNSVTKIHSYAFDECSGLTSVTIGNSVTTIYPSAFQGCTGLTEVTIPKSVNVIYENVFSGCTGLAKVIWNAKNHVDIDLISLLWKDTNIKTFEFGNEVERIPERLCYNLSGLTMVAIPNSVTDIGQYAFFGCSGVKSVTIGNSVASIGNNAFYNCSSLTSVTIGNSVTSIGNNAFYNCSSLTSVTIGNSVTSIGNSAFSGCSGLTSLTIPNSVTDIGQSAFFGCSGVKSVTIGNSVASIGNNAFYKCSSLTSVTIPESVTSIGNKAFSGCSNLTSVIWHAKNCKDLQSGSNNLFIGSGLSGDPLDVKSFIFSNEVEHIPAYLCYYLSGLKNIYSNILHPEEVTLGSTVFTNVSKTACTLHVPRGLAPLYKTLDQWKDFNNIVDDLYIEGTGGGGVELCSAGLGMSDLVIGEINTVTRIPFSMVSSFDISGFSFTVSLPDQLEIVDDINTFIEAGERGADFTINAVRNDDGTITVTGIVGEEPLAAGEGVIAVLKVKTQWQKTYSIPLTKMTVTTADGETQELPDRVTKLVMTGTRGDMNGDNRVDLSDALYILNMVTGQAE